MSSVFGRATRLGRQMYTKVSRKFCTSTKNETSTSTSSSSLPVNYNASMSTLHWIMAGGILSIIGLVEVAKRTDRKNPLKGNLMFYHKSIGLLMGGLIVGRLGLRFMSKLPGPVPNAAPWQHYAANIGHFGLYSLMIFLPTTGIIMGYYGGKGLPFFVTTIPGASKENKNGAWAKQAYLLHKKAGTLLEIFVAGHIGGALLHSIQGHTIFTRILPFLGSSLFIDLNINENDVNHYLKDNQDDEYNQIIIQNDENENELNINDPLESLE